MEDARLVRLLECIIVNAPSYSALKIAARFDDPLTENEIKIFDEVLMRISRIETLDARAKLAIKLAKVHRGPVRTVKELSYDLHSEVATPLLSGSVLVLEEDLISIAHVRSQQHLRAIAERHQVSVPVTDVVLRRGTWPVLRTLSANKSAQLSKAGLLRLVTISRGDGHITVALTKRQDVPPATKKALLMQFKHMVERQRPPWCGENSDVRLDALSSRNPLRGYEPSGRFSVVEEALSDPEVRDATARVQKTQKARPLTHFDVTRALTQGQLAEALAIISRFAEVDVDILVQSLSGKGSVRHHALLIMKAADLPWEVADRILQDVEFAGKGRNDQGHRFLSSQRQAYGDLNRQAAQQALKMIRFRSRMRVIEGGAIGEQI